MYQSVIGLEIHIELNTRSKMFCGCVNDPNERHPNLNICPICLGHPGTLPVINKEAIKKVIKTALSFNCQIPPLSKFDRKSYFYPDLPKGYQISQYDTPLSKSGYLDFKVNDEKRRVRIRRVHLEEDTGRLIHPKGKDYSLVDFNRAGIPLMELVTEPDLRIAKEARKFSEELQLILRYLDVSSADMEKGQMRVEANVSLASQEDVKKGKLGVKVEIKNLNSFRAVERAINYEIKRQEKILTSGKIIVQETRGWDEISGVTKSQREKEYAHDYRYFPEPDLPPITWQKKDIEKIRAEIPELPQPRRQRLQKEYHLSDKETEFFVFNKELEEYFEKVISELEPKLSPSKLSALIKLTINYLITDLQGLLKGESVAVKDFLITPENFAEFITLIHQGKISSKIAKMVLEEMFKTGADPSHIIDEKELIQITDETHIEEIVNQAISENPKAVSDLKQGKEGALQFLIGQVMAKTKGRANPEIVSKILEKKLT